MTFTQLDLLIRAAVPEEEARRDILKGLHEIEEGVTLCSCFFLGVTGHVLTEQGAWEKRENTIFQVNTALKK